MTSKSTTNSAIHETIDTPDNGSDLSKYEFVNGNHVPQHLTKREREILNWLSQGKNSFEISCILGICESTVKFHVNNALTKLEATNRTHAVAKALRLQLI